MLKSCGGAWQEQKCGRADQLDSAVDLASQNTPSCAAAARIQATVEHEAHG